MSQPRRPLFDSYASAKGSPAQQNPNLHAEATTAAPKPERQDDRESGNAADELNNATQHKPQMAQIEEAMKSQSEGLRQTSSRLPSTHTEVPTVAFQTIVFGIMRQLFKEIEENSERARVFAQACSSTLSPRDLQTIAQFQGQLGSSDTLGGDPPYPVAENMEISRRYILYEGGCFDREGTENAFRENKLARIRDNQRRSRARRREYVQDLKRRLREYETQGIEASTEVQMAARRVAEENKQLQELFNRHGISDDQITRFLQSGTLPLDSNQGQPFHADDPSAAVQSLQRLLMPRQLASLDEDFSLYLSGQSIPNPSTTEGSTTSSSVWEPSQLVTSSYGYQHHMGVATAVMASAVHSPYPPTTPLSRASTTRQGCVYGGQPSPSMHDSPGQAMVTTQPTGTAL
ncbi:hypothetical protein HRG_012651 [Hirsutella rhossiliensis]